MCVIISKRLPGKLDDDIIAKSLIYNPHGFGILMLDNGEVHKTMDMSVAADWLTSERPFVFHARLRTVGNVDLSNVQPIMVREGNYLFHNGTVQTPRSWDKKASDSRFVAETLRGTPGRQWRNILSMTESRFLWTVVKDGRMQPLISGKWHRHDDVYYSKDNVLKGNLVAVYGTLRSGYGNNHLLYGSDLLDSGYTVEKLRMTCQGIPYVLSGEHEDGNNLKVEVYNVPDSDMADLDRLEGHPDWYVREKTKVHLDCGITVDAWLYFNNSFDDNTYYADYQDYRQPDRPKQYNNELPDPFTDLMYDHEEGKYFNLDTGEYIENDPNQLNLKF